MAEKTKSYRIEFLYYRAGVRYEPGSIVTIPADEKPARSWVEVKTAADEKPAEKPTPKK